MEHRAICSRDTAFFAISLGFHVSGDCFYELHCIPTQDAETLNVMCEEKGLMKPEWFPPLRAPQLVSSE